MIGLYGEAETFDCGVRLGLEVIRASTTELAAISRATARVWRHTPLLGRGAAWQPKCAVQYERR
jgi:hypothetical protein